jgi:hypothetical protein
MARAAVNFIRTQTGLRNSAMAARPKGAPLRGGMSTPSRAGDDIAARAPLSLAKTAAGLSLDRNVRPTAPSLARTLGAPGGKGAGGGSLLSMPRSTVAEVRSTRQALEAVSRGSAAKGPLAAPPRGAGVSCSTGTDTDGAEPEATAPGFDIFGMRTGAAGDGSDDFADDADGGPVGGGFWMPGASLPTPPRSAEVQRKQPQGPKEFFDGYNLWHQWESRTAGKPFWHCKETGETRWEKPTTSAVQEVPSPLRAETHTMPCAIRPPPDLLALVVAAALFQTPTLPAPQLSQAAPRAALLIGPSPLDGQAANSRHEQRSGPA